MLGIDLTFLGRKLAIHQVLSLFTRFLCGNIHCLWKYSQSAGGGGGGGRGLFAESMIMCTGFHACRKRLS